MRRFLIFPSENISWNRLHLNKNKPFRKVKEDGLFGPNIHNCTIDSNWNRYNRN